MDGDLAREHDLLEVAGADPLDRARDRGLVVLRRSDRRDAELPGGGRVEQRQRRVAQLAHAPLEPGDQLLGDVVGRGQRGEGEPHVGAAAGQRQLRDHEVGGLEAGPVRRRAAVVGEREAADGHEPGAGRAVRRVGLGRARERAPGGRGAREAIGAATLDPVHAAQRGECGARAVGLLEAEPRLAVATRCEDGGAGVDRRGDRHGHGDQHLAPAAARAPDGALAALAQRRDGRCGQDAHSAAAHLTTPVAQ
jgi:hypothetical protein